MNDDADPDETLFSLMTDKAYHLLVHGDVDDDGGAFVPSKNEFDARVRLASVVEALAKRAMLEAVEYVCASLLNVKNNVYEVGSNLGKTGPGFVEGVDGAFVATCAFLEAVRGELRGDLGGFTELEGTGDEDHGG